MSKLQILIKGLIRENPTFVLLLGMCPTLGTTSATALPIFALLAAAMGSWVIS